MRAQQPLSARGKDHDEMGTAYLSAVTNQSKLLVSQPFLHALELTIVLSLFFTFRLDANTISGGRSHTCMATRAHLVEFIQFVLEVIEIPEAFEVNFIVPLQLTFQLLILVHECGPAKICIATARHRLRTPWDPDLASEVRRT